MAEQDTTQEQAAKNPVEARIDELRAEAKRLEAIAQKPFLSMTDDEQQTLLAIVKPTTQAQPSSNGNGESESKLPSVSAATQEKVRKALAITFEDPAAISKRAKVSEATAKNALKHLIASGMVRTQKAEKVEGQRGAPKSLYAAPAA